MSNEGGFTLIEMMIATVLGLMILSATLALVTVTTRNQARIANRVAANQRARPVMTYVLNQLHSGCVSPGLAPIKAESSGTSLNFVSKAGSTVSPTPDRHIISLSGTTLSESIYPATGGAAPNWTFATTPSSTRTLLTGVGAPSTVPMFRYFAYSGGTLSTTPLATPLDANNAAKTVEVAVGLATSPSPAGVPPQDPKAPITLIDSAVLRLEPASEDSSEVNLPCV